MLKSNKLCVKMHYLDKNYCLGYNKHVYFFPNTINRIIDTEYFYNTQQRSSKGGQLRFAVFDW
jgi:hypothetical protein